MKRVNTFAYLAILLMIAIMVVIGSDALMRASIVVPALKTNEFYNATSDEIKDMMIINQQMKKSISMLSEEEFKRHKTNNPYLQSESEVYFCFSMLADGTYLTGGNYLPNQRIYDAMDLKWFRAVMKSDKIEVFLGNQYSEIAKNSILFGQRVTLENGEQAAIFIELKLDEVIPDNQIDAVDSLVYDANDNLVLSTVHGGAAIQSLDEIFTKKEEVLRSNTSLQVYKAWIDKRTYLLLSFYDEELGLQFGQLYNWKEVFSRYNWVMMTAFVLYAVIALLIGMVFKIFPEKQALLTKLKRRVPEEINLEPDDFISYYEDEMKVIIRALYLMNKSKTPVEAIDGDFIELMIDLLNQKINQIRSRDDLSKTESRVREFDINLLINFIVRISQLNAEELNCRFKLIVNTGKVGMVIGHNTLLLTTMLDMVFKVCGKGKNCTSEIKLTQEGLKMTLDGASGVDLSYLEANLEYMSGQHKIREDILEIKIPLLMTKEDLKNVKKTVSSELNAEALNLSEAKLYGAFSQISNHLIMEKYASVFNYTYGQMERRSVSENIVLITDEGMVDEIEMNHGILFVLVEDKQKFSRRGEPQISVIEKPLTGDKIIQILKAAEKLKTDK